MINSYGVFQAYYETNLLSDHSPKTISWIGSIQTFLILFVGAIIGPLYDAGFFRALIISGSSLVSFGLMITSISSHYWHFLLSQAFCVGLGTGCIYVPSLAIIPQYFASRRALATGIVTSGGSLGGVVYPLLFETLLPLLGFGWTVRVLAFTSLTTCAISIAILRPRGKPSKRRPMLDVSAFRSTAYILFAFAMFASYIGFFAPIFYLQQYAVSHGLSKGKLAHYLVSILNASSIVGRIVPAYFARHLGPVNMLLTVSIIVTVVTLCWISVRSGAGNVVFAVAYGMSSGGLTSLPAAVMSTLVPDLSVFGSWLGMVSSMNAFASLSGPPIAGALLQSTGSFLGVQLLSGLAMGLTASLMIALRVEMARQNRTWRA